MNTALFPHNGLDNSEYNVIQAQVCTALAHNSDRVGVVSEDLNGLVPNDVQKGLKTVKKSPHFSQCATGCVMPLMPQLGGEETLCLQFLLLHCAACNF